MVSEMSSIFHSKHELSNDPLCSTQLTLLEGKEKNIKENLTTHILW